MAAAKAHVPQAVGSTKRRRLSLAFGGWCSSTLAGYVFDDDESTYLQNFRMSRQSLKLLCRMIKNGGRNG
eukprot:1330649-Pleurochrysis_carterae.AAC.1